MLKQLLPACGAALHLPVVYAAMKINMEKLQTFREPDRVAGDSLHIDDFVAFPTSLNYGSFGSFKSGPMILDYSREMSRDVIAIN